MKKIRNIIDIKITMKWKCNQNNKKEEIINTNKIEKCKGCIMEMYQKKLIKTGKNK